MRRLLTAVVVAVAIAVWTAAGIAAGFITVYRWHEIDIGTNNTYCGITVQSAQVDACCESAH